MIFSAVLLLFFFLRHSLRYFPYEPKTSRYHVVSSVLVPWSSLHCRLCPFLSKCIHIIFTSRIPENRSPMIISFSSFPHNPIHGESWDPDRVFLTSLLLWSFLFFVSFVPSWCRDFFPTRHSVISFSMMSFFFVRGLDSTNSRFLSWGSTWKCELHGVWS